MLNCYRPIYSLWPAHYQRAGISWHAIGSLASEFKIMIICYPKSNCTGMGRLPLYEFPQWSSACAGAVAFITANPVTISPYICFKLLLIHPVIEILRQINFCMIVWEIVPEEVAVCLFPRSPVSHLCILPAVVFTVLEGMACMFLFHVVGNVCLRKPSACAWLKSKLLFWSGHYRCCMHLAAAAGIM